MSITGYGYYTIDTPNAVASNLQSQLTTMTKERDAARQERDAAVRVIQPRNVPNVAPQAAQTPASPPPNEDPNIYPSLTRERERALVEELVAARNILGSVPLIAAGAHNDARNYRAALMPLFERAQIVTPTSDDSTGGPDQTGVMVAIADLNNPSEGAKKILEILTATGFRPRVIQAKPGHGDYYIFIGPQPL